jgi:hypothetical protein
MGVDSSHRPAPNSAIRWGDCTAPPGAERVMGRLAGLLGEDAPRERDDHVGRPERSRIERIALGSAIGVVGVLALGWW